LPGLSPILVAGLIQFKGAMNSVKNKFDRILLCHSLEYCTHSAELALVALYGPFCCLSVFHLYMHAL